MRVTITRTPNTRCAICGELIEVGAPGVNFSAATSTIRRGHVKCVDGWRTAQIRKMQHEKQRVPH